MQRPHVFASGHLDRAHRLRRDDEAVRSARSDDRSRIVVVWRSKSLVAEREEPRAALLTPSEISDLLEEEERTVPLVLLGVHEEMSYFALDVSHVEQPDERSELRGRGEFIDLRQVGSLLEPKDSALLAYARAITNWHRSHLFCGSCGGTTESREAGHLRVCSNPDCGAQTFPRTDPAVIMLVHDGKEHCLLGRQAAWPPGVYSTLAGFVEPGESLEEAVIREVREETGIEVEAAHYHSSQPWPFPSSIMLGFVAQATRGEVRLDHDELEEARWFERDDLVRLNREREVRFPPRMSIARRLIDDWLESGSS